MMCIVYGGSLAGPRCHVLLLFEQSGGHDVHSGAVIGLILVYLVLQCCQVSVVCRVVAELEFAMHCCRAGDHAEGHQWVR